MKKVLAFLAALTLVVSVTACGDKIRQENQSDQGQTSSDNSDISSANSPGQTGSGNSDSSDNSDNESSEPEPEQPAWHRSDEEGFKDMIDIFTMDDIKVPDGVLKKADADYLYGNSEYVVCAGYDFSYLRKVRPYFRNTFDEPGMINWDTMEIANEPESSVVPYSDYFKIKAGDVLDNGLKVKTAQTAFGFAGDGLISDMKVELDGEITIEGILKCMPEDEYIIGKGELILYPDSVKHSDILAHFDEYISEPWTYVDPEYNFAMSFNGDPFYLGLVDNAPAGVSDLFANDTFIKAKVTISDIRFKTGNGGIRGFATVKSVEKLG